MQANQIQTHPLRFDPAPDSIKEDAAFKSKRKDAANQWCKEDDRQKYLPPQFPFLDLISGDEKNVEGDAEPWINQAISWKEGTPDLKGA